MLIWGLSFVWYKEAFENFNPVSIIFIRLFISVILLVPYAFISKRILKLEKKHFHLFLLLAFFEPFLYFIGESFGLKFVSATVASVIISLIPLITPVAAYIFYREKFSGQNILGLFISFFGVMLVVYFSDNEIHSSWKGIALLFLSVISTVGYTAFVKKLTSHYNPLSIIIYQNIIGAVYFIPLVLWLDIEALCQTTWSFHALLPLLKLSVFASSIAFVFFIQGIRILGMTKATVFANFIPVFACFFAWYILNDKISPWQITGILFVIIGLLLSQVKVIK